MRRPVDGPKVTWKVGAWGKPRAASKGIDVLAAYVKEQTGGNFTINVGYGSYGEPKELLDLVSVGALEATNMCSSYHPEKHPGYTGARSSVPAVPQCGRAGEGAREIPSAPLRQAGAGEVEGASSSCRRCCRSMSSSAAAVTAPKKLSDWKGLRVRAIGGIGAAMAKLGAVPTSVDATEVYNLIERGTVDAASFPSTYAHGSYRTYEVGKWFTTNLSPGTQSCPVVIGIEAWNKLPKQYQELLEKGKQLAYVEQKKAYGEADEKYLAEFKKKKLEFITYSKEDLAEFQKVGGKPVWDEWVAEKSKQGIPAQELLDLILDTAKAAAPKS